MSLFVDCELEWEELRTPHLCCTVALVATFNTRTSVRIWNPTCGPRPAPRPIWGLFTSSQRAHAAGLPTIFFAPFKFQVANCEIGACLFGRRRVMIAWKKVPLEGFVYGWWQGRRVEGKAWPWLLSLDSWKWWIMDYVSEEVRDRKGHGVIQKYERRWHFQANSPPPGRLDNPPDFDTLTRICPTPILAGLHFDTFNPFDSLLFSL